MKMETIIGNGAELAGQIIAERGIILGICCRIRAMQGTQENIPDNGWVI